VLDGDCALQPGWIEAAAAFLASHPDVAAVCGRRRERFPAATRWNQLADVEWDTEPGTTDSFGGDAMIRADAWRQARGYDASLIAGEDPEFSWRLRRAGGRIVRLDAEMTLHDAALTSLSQWWRRQTRSGHAYVETVFRHRAAPDPSRARRVAALVFWGGVLPLACLGFAWPTHGASLAGLAAYVGPWRGAFRSVRTRWPRRVAVLWATFCVVAKFAELQGAATFAFNHWVRRRATGLIEYKGPGT
jgi:cellulose synthase/poly-beta-1,6-N-acetylglucosamine synthase-like glycosyltransferase